MSKLQYPAASFTIILDDKLHFPVVFINFTCLFDFWGVENAPNSVHFGGFWWKIVKENDLFYRNLQFSDAKKVRIPKKFGFRFFPKKLITIVLWCFWRVYEKTEKIDKVVKKIKNLFLKKKTENKPQKLEVFVKTNKEIPRLLQNDALRSAMQSLDNLL